MNNETAEALCFAQERALRQKVLLFAVAVAIVYGTWFGANALSLEKYVLATIDFSIAIIFVFAGIFTVKRPNSRLPERIVACTTALFFLYLFISGGIEGIGPLWSFILPLIIFFLTGFKGGITISLIYLGICICVFFYNSFFPGLFYQHSQIFVHRFIGIFLLSAVVSGAYEYQKQRNEKYLRSLLDEIAAARNRAETANAAKSSFLAMVSHEIRTPINGINGITELLTDSSLDEQQAKYVSIMRNSCDTLLSLVNDLLDLAKIESGKMLLHEESFALHEFIDEVAEPFKLKTEQKGLKFATNKDPELPRTICGDRLRLKQVLANLIDNAVKFTEKGAICLKISRIDGTNGEKRLLFEVLDTGIGIESKDLARIFDDFHQADSSTAKNFGGTGLGLAIAKKLVELMHGKLSGDSKPGEGSRFYFNIPLKTSS